MKRFSATLALAIFSMAATAQTSATDHRPYIAPQVSYGIFDDSNGFELEDGVGYGGAIGIPVLPWLNLEAQYFRFDDIDVENLPGNVEAEVEGYGVSALIFPLRRLFPAYIVGGYSYGDFDLNVAGVSEQGHIYDIGLGYIQPINDYGLALRAEYRYRITDVDDPSGFNFDDDFDNHVATLYLQIPIGSRPGPAPLPVKRTTVPAAPADSDNDGIPDSRDQCPGTPANTAVDISGCALAVSEPPPPEAPIVLKGVTFEYDSARLTASATQRLDNVVSALSAEPGFGVLIAGHTDSIGSAEYNQKLSAERAASVADYLAAHGISRSRLQSRGYGETRPVAPNVKPDGSDNPAGRAQNRRVELEIVGQ